jgi:hypothetical protein
MQKWPTEADLRKYLKRWQRMLRLQHWRIKISYGRTREMIADDGHSGSISWGRCTMNDNHLRARVMVLHPDDYDDDDGREEIEQTVVHELLHIQMIGMRDAIKGPDPAGDVVEEQVINVNADLLVGLYRQLHGEE